MIEPNKLQAELVESLTKIRDKYECTHDDLVKYLDYALKDIRYPAPAHTGSPIPTESKTKATKENPNPVSKSDAAQTRKEEKAEVATSRTHL